MPARGSAFGSGPGRALAGSAAWLMLAGISAAPASAQPVAREAPVTERMFGQSVTDPYRWMERGRWMESGRWMDSRPGAGGILIGGAITRRPDLFRAALIRVGATNMLRDEFSESGPADSPEFGSIADRAQFPFLSRMDALHQVRDGVAYPAVLLTGGAGDPRVPAWEPAKMTARLQKASSGGRPVLLRVEFDAGHGIGSTRTQRDAETADEQAFLLWQMGEPGYQPAAP